MAPDQLPDVVHPKIHTDQRLASDVDRASRSDKILFLDGLRGLAAMVVVAYHSYYMVGINLGAPAVDTFFVLSAFLLTLIFEKKVETLLQQNASRRRWALALADYFQRRFLRVYPLFAFIACALALLSDNAQETIFGAKTYYQYYNLFKTLIFSVDYRYHVFWTLPIEIGYYFIIPAFVVAVIKLRGRWWVLAGAGYAWVFYSGLCCDRSSHRSMWPHVPTFLCGSLAAVVYGKLNHQIQKRNFIFSARQRLLLCGVQLTTIAIILSDCFGGLLFDWIAPNPFPRRAGDVPFVSFNVTGVIVIEMLTPGPLTAILEWCVLRYAGKVSYSMYLWHNWIVLSGSVNRMPYYNKFFAIWTLVFAVSSVSYRLIEAPSQRLAATLGSVIKHYDEKVQKREPYASVAQAPTLEC